MREHFKECENMTLEELLAQSNGCDMSLDADSRAWLNAPDVGKEIVPGPEQEHSSNQENKT